MAYILSLSRRIDAAARLGLQPVLFAVWHRTGGRLLARRALRDAAGPAGPLPPGAAPPAPAVPAAHGARVLGRARAAGPADWHGPFPPAPHALDLDLFAPGDIRPIWERNRWAELPLLAQAARLDPGGGPPAPAGAPPPARSARQPPLP